MTNKGKTRNKSKGRAGRRPSQPSTSSGSKSEPTPTPAPTSAPTGNPPTGDADTVEAPDVAAALFETMTLHSHSPPVPPSAMAASRTTNQCAAAINATADGASSCAAATSSSEPCPRHPGGGCITVSTSDYVSDLDNGMFMHFCDEVQARIVLTFATFIICGFLMRRHGRTKPPGSPIVEAIHRRISERMKLIIGVHGPLTDIYAAKGSTTLSLQAHCALMHAQEYLLLGGLDDRKEAARLALASAASCHATDEQHSWFAKFYKAWLFAIPVKEMVQVADVDSIKPGDRLHDLIVHFRRGYKWPRSFHGTRVVVFGFADMLNKTEFDEGQVSKSCLNCKAKYKTTLAWRKHLLTTTKHEVYLCCGKQWRTLPALLKHVRDVHEGKLGMLEPFILSSNPPMDCWD